MMRYVFRADASPEIGSGHVMRVSAIAEEVISRGSLAIFIGEITNLPWVKARLDSLGFQEVISNPKEFNINSKTDVLILDAYHIPLNDSLIDIDTWHKIVTISDESTPPYASDLTIHIGKDNDSQVKSKIKTVSGMKYFPLRKNIKSMDVVDSINCETRVLIVGGGTDINEFSKTICSALLQIQHELQITVFSNSKFSNLSSKNLQVLPIGPELDIYAQYCDLAITTASTTAIEFIARGIAVGVASAVSNQEQFYTLLVDKGVAKPVGKFIDGVWVLNTEVLQELATSKILRKNLREMGKKFIDLNGASRIVDEIEKMIRLQR